MTPPRLDHPDVRIREVMDRALQELRLRDEVRIENAEKIALRGCESGFERASFEPGPISALDQLYIQSAVAQLGDTSLCQLLRVVGRIIQHLDLQPIARIIQTADRIEQTLDDVDLIENRQLH